MENSKLLIFPKARILLLASILILVGSIVFVIPSFHKAQARSYLQMLESLSFNRYLHLPIDYEGVAHFGAWDGYLFTAAEYQCVLGGHYSLLAHADTEADKTVIWLQPGQECWPEHPNCGYSRVYSDEEALAYMVAGANASPFGPTSADPDNPVAGWNYIYVPTCDGSFHFGDAAADYDKDGAPDHFHNGLRQTSAAVSLMKELFPNSRKILIAGSSNGGYGTFGATPIARLAFPDARLYVLDDSGPGLFRPEEPALWPTLIKTWNLASMLPPNCRQCQDQLIYLFDWMLDYDSNLKIGMYTSYQDAVVSQVVGMTGAENEQLLRTTTAQIHQNHPHTFKRYFIQGDSHCIADFYNQVNGVTVWMWLDAFVNDHSGWGEILE
ncbi:MAG TPA: pectin acetylesterase-family hydrolase [Anaerolineales bacterium]|nr:pectin acetylesterase-family hydrolase [Anaerolineales bacterium]